MQNSYISRPSEYFEALKQILVQSFPEDSAELRALAEHVKIMHRDYASLDYAFPKLKTLFFACFRFQTDPVYAQELFRFTWLLYLVSKERLIPNCNDLAPPVVGILLLYSFRFVANHVPREHIKCIVDGTHFT